MIAAVRKNIEFEKALKSNVEMIFDLNPDILMLNSKIDAAHKCGKRLFIHLDLASGIGKDKSGISYLKNAGVDGIISTRVNIIKNARELGMMTIQRFFIVDSQSLYSSIDSIFISKPDIIEVMPGTVSKILKELHNKTNIPIIAGGLIENEAEIEEALQSGAMAVSSGRSELWNLY